MKIGNKQVTQEGPPIFIADIGANHDGSLERAFRLIELAAESGADAAKFQNFSADLIVSKYGFDNLGDKLDHQSDWKKTVYETYRDASISNDWTFKLKNKCNEFGIEYFTSPYDFQSVKNVLNFVNWIKIGSGDITWLEIIEFISKQNKNIILATGASDINDVKRAVDLICNNHKIFVLMQCNTNYTGKEENFKFINLNVLNLYKKMFPKLILGLSDHTEGDATVLGALALGARVFEKHFTDDNSRSGPDHKFAMNPKTWKSMVKNANRLYNSFGNGSKVVEENEKDTFLIQRRGIWLKNNIMKNDYIKRDDIIPLRPQKIDGFSANQIKDLIGKQVKHDLKANEYVRKEDIL